MCSRERKGLFPLPFLWKKPPDVAKEHTGHDTERDPYQFCFFIVSKPHTMFWSWLDRGYIYMYVYIHIYMYIYVYIYIYIYIYICVYIRSIYDAPDEFCGQTIFSSAAAVVQQHIFIGTQRHVHRHQTKQTWHARESVLRVRPTRRQPVRCPHNWKTVPSGLGGKTPTNHDH